MKHPDVSPRSTSAAIRRDYGKRGLRHRQRGYVLLAVLAVSVLMVTTLAALSQISFRRAMAAADAKVRLQQRLGSDSIEAVVLPRIAKVFADLEKDSDETRKLTGAAPTIPRQIRSAVSFGGVTFDVVVADEDAKLNLNQIYHVAGQERAQEALAELVGPTAARAIRLAPAQPPLGASLKMPARRTLSGDDASDDEDRPEPSLPNAFRSWGEVFDLRALAEVFGNDAALPNVTAEVTCWGGSGLNMRRASDGSMRTAASAILSGAGADRLVSRYRENPAMSLAILVQREGKTETERIGLRRMLGETSTHFSLWIDASARARRSQRTFSVTRKTDEGISINERFAF